MRAAGTVCELTRAPLNARQPWGPGHRTPDVAAASAAPLYQVEFTQSDLNQNVPTLTVRAVNADMLKEHIYGYAMLVRARTTGLIGQPD